MFVSFVVSLAVVTHLHFLSVCLTRPESFNQAVFVVVFSSFLFVCLFVCLLTNEISLTY